MTARDWLHAFASELGGAAPDNHTVEALLALAGQAAHASERWAAPLACWIVGRAGVDPARARMREQGGRRRADVRLKASRSAGSNPAGWRRPQVRIASSPCADASAPRFPWDSDPR